MLINLVERMRSAIEHDDTNAMRDLLNAMRRGNVGESYIPGLRDLCKKARSRLSEQKEQKQ